MILDSSVILAILFAEPDALLYAAAIERAASRRLSAACPAGRKPVSLPLPETPQHAHDRDLRHDLAGRLAG
jgi:hypothetical protein